MQHVFLWHFGFLRSSLPPTVRRSPLNSDAFVWAVLSPRDELPRRNVLSAVFRFFFSQLQTHTFLPDSCWCAYIMSIMIGWFSFVKNRNRRNDLCTLECVQTEFVFAAWDVFRF